MLEAAEVWQHIDAADLQMKAMVLLAVNAGFGNSDVGTLPLAALATNYTIWPAMCG